MKTTAQLRNEAYDAAQARNWPLAADLYAEALAAYPAHHVDNTSAKHDKAALQRRAASARAIANEVRRHDASYR